MKGIIQADHIPVNKFKLLVLGLPPVVFTAISGIEEELDVVDLPDRTKASGGRTKAIEFTGMMPQHHIVEQALMEVWFQEGQDPVLPTYKKAASLVLESVSGSTVRTYSLIGLFVSKRKLPDLEMDNDGEMAETEWTFQADDMLPI